MIKALKQQMYLVRQRPFISVSMSACTMNLTSLSGLIKWTLVSSPSLRKREGRREKRQQHFKGEMGNAVSLIKWKFRIIGPRSVKPEHTIRCQHECSAVIYATVYCILSPSVDLLASQASFNVNCTALKLLISVRVSILGYIK